MRYLLPGIFLFLFAAGICRAEIITVATNTANLRSSPSLSASYVVLQVPRFYPLSVKGTRDEFIEVKDYRGRTGWVHQSVIDRDLKGVVVEVSRANVRKGPGTNYPIAFRAYDGVTFRVLDERDGWLEIRHESGQRGWIFKPLTWGR